ncbi:MAG: protein kinase, partial [Verrucomicrobia bacterium]|nr:protein kinase [Verrucomicrobiota bacterium]
MLLQVRKCPGCREERSAQEVLCGNCSWDLTQEPLRIGGQSDPSPEVFDLVSETRVCSNGHPVDSHDEICFTCGAAVVTEPSNDGSPEEHETIVDGWTVIERLEGIEGLFESFIIERHGYRANLTLYFPGAHPELSIYEVFKKIPKGFVPEVLALGTWECRRYLVTELISHPNLLDLHSTSLDLAALQQIVKSIGRILSSLSDNGLRHGNLCPENIFITNRDPLKLMVSGFHYSHLSAFDLDFVKQPISACYIAPEVIAGGISVASDWWSLGMVILELITKGACFEEINEKAFKIHVVTRGISLPKGIDPSIHLLLRGLLASDTDQRWQWNQVQRWLAGELVEAPQDNRVEENSNGPALDFKDLSYTCPKTYALIAAEAANWEQAKDFFLRGVIATWLEDRQADPKTIAGIRLAASIDSLHEDFRHSLALMWMNPNLPLIYKGEIITSAWMLQNPIQGYELINGPLVAQLRQMNREMHFCDLHNREVRARERAKALEIELNEESFRLIALASSRSNLERQWAMHRKLYPGSDHGGLNSLMERQKVTDEELMVLLGAAIQQYQSAEEVLSQSKAIATQSQVLTYEESNARIWFDVSRRDIYREIEARIANYSRCGIIRVDEWANDFRIERRVSLPRALVLISIPPESWQEPPRQQYFSAILEFFEKRTASLAQRGPLVRMLIGKSSSRVDMARVVGKKSTATSILEHLISRVEAPVSFERIAFKTEPDLEQRMRHLISHAKTYKRDTGIDSLYLGFPFLVMKDNSF